MLPGWVLLLFLGWLAGTVSGSAGFGGALLLLPVLAFTVGSKAAVPILTVARSSATSRGLRSAGEISGGVRPSSSVPVPSRRSVLEARLFVGLPSTFLLRLMGVLLLSVVALRHTPLGKRNVPEGFLAPAGFGVGLLSAIAGSAGPLGAAVFLGLKLPPQAYVASEAIAEALTHLTKSLTYGRYAAMTLDDFRHGLALGGSWAGRKLIDRLPERGFTPGRSPLGCLDRFAHHGKRLNLRRGRVEKLIQIGFLSLGGVFGVNARYWLGHWVNRWASQQFPWATFLINVTGSFAIGFLTMLLARWLPHQNFRLLVVTGFLGGYTTYSTFALESLTLWERGERGIGLGYMASTLLAGFLAVSLGVALARNLTIPQEERATRSDRRPEADSNEKPPVTASGTRGAS